MNLVVNEWLLEFFLPGTLPENYEELFRFFDSVQECKRKIIIGRETQFTIKFYRFMKLYGNNLSFKQNYVKLHRLLFIDTTRTIIVERHEIKNIPDKDMEGVHSDDRYLLELAASVPNSIIISTDNRLIDALARMPQYPIIHLKDYLKTFNEKGCE